MYWQVYFHPVTRSAEVILSKILQRAKYLFENNYTFKLKPFHFISFFNEDVGLDDYLKLDESIVFYYFQLWQEEDEIGRARVGKEGRSRCRPHRLKEKRVG